MGVCSLDLLKNFPAWIVDPLVFITSLDIINHPPQLWTDMGIPPAEMIGSITDIEQECPITITTKFEYEIKTVNCANSEV